MIQIYGRKKCAATRKAERFFSERRIPIQSIDVEVKPPGRREIELFIQVIGAEPLIDTGSRLYRDRGLAYLEYDPAEEITDHPAILRTPVVRSGRVLAVGDDESSWKRIAAAEST